eukprot:scaffold241189_cov39-Prasinocladus_malaysianus.AAC.1
MAVETHVDHSTCNMHKTLELQAGDAVGAHFSLRFILSQKGQNTYCGVSFSHALAEQDTPVVLAAGFVVPADSRLSAATIANEFHTMMHRVQAQYSPTRYAVVFLSISPVGGRREKPQAMSNFRMPSYLSTLCSYPSN